MNILTYFLYNIEVLVWYSKCRVQAFSYHECIKVNPLDGCTFSPHGIIKGRHLVKSLNIRMAQISMKIVIFSRLVQYNYNQTINLIIMKFRTIFTVVVPVLGHTMTSQLTSTFYLTGNFHFHSNILIFHFKVLKM